MLIYITFKIVNWHTVKSTNIQGYDVKSYPTTYLIDPNGIIIATNLRGSDLLNKLHSLKAKDN